MPDPVIPEKPVQEGSRWRYRRPSSEEVAAWFKTVPLDEGMKHEDFIAGVVLIPADEKVKKPKPDGRGTEEVYEQTWTPYVRVDTRVSYFRKLAAQLGQMAVIEPATVPRVEQPAYYNLNMADGFWWQIQGESQAAQRFLCATWRVALYDLKDWISTDNEGRRQLAQLREGQGTKAVTGAAQIYSKPNVDALARAETGAIGRALGVAGILVVGTGIATAEDMESLREAPVASPVTLPGTGAPEETSEELDERLVALQMQLRVHTDAWREFSAWWTERSRVSGWTNVSAAPIEARRGVATKMAQMIVEAENAPPPDSSPDEPRDPTKT